MNTNENIQNDTSEDVIELGVASVETQGSVGFDEPNGGGPINTGISED